MDAVQFDAFTQQITARLSRRSLGLLAALGLRAHPSPDEAEARKRRKKKKPCPPCKKRKKGKCKKRLPDGTPCEGGFCQAGVCIACADGSESCGGTCVRTCFPPRVREPATCGCCMPNTPAFSPPVGACSANSECCGGGICCNFGDGFTCVDPTTNQSACGPSGATCDDLTNCINFLPDRQCVNGQCVEV